jgi:hypothetical protein
MTTHIEYWNEHFDDIMADTTYKYSKLYPVVCPQCKLGFSRSNVVQWCPECQKNVSTIENNNDYTE